MAFVFTQDAERSGTLSANIFLVMRHARLLTGIAIVFAVVAIVGVLVWRQQSAERGGEGNVVAIYSVPMSLCVFYETSEPFAEVDTYYVYDGRYMIATTTDMTCDDEQEIEYAIVGERVTLDNPAVPRRLRREDGTRHAVEVAGSDAPVRPHYLSIQSAMDRSESPFRGQGQLRIGHVQEAVAACRSLRQEQEHDECLAFLAGTTRTTGPCDAISNASFRDRCFAWIPSMKEAE